MQINITNELMDSTDLIFVTKSLDKSKNSAVTIRNGTHIIKELGVLSSYETADGEYGEEETFRQCCRAAIDYTIQNGHKNVVFDVPSFVDNSLNISYITNTILEYLPQIADEDQLNELTITLLLPKIGKYEQIINELEDVLAKPVKIQAAHSYGDYGDPLKEQFKEFQKTLGQGKTFREHLIDLMDKKEIRKSTEVYKPSGISKYTFSKLINFSINPPHKPSKETVAALSIGLKLNLEEAEEFYSVAGYSLGKTEFIDKVIRFFIHKKIYKIDEVNYCLAYHGYPLLGERMRGESTRVVIK